jgi:hypothetical protein
MANVVQKKEESIREFIQCFCSKRNGILEVNDKSTIMFFKNGLRDSSLIRKLTIKNPRKSKEIRSWSTRISPTPPRVMIRRGKQTTL